MYTILENHHLHFSTIRTLATNRSECPAMKHTVSNSRRSPPCGHGRPTADPPRTQSRAQRRQGSELPCCHHTAARNMLQHIETEGPMSRGSCDQPSMSLGVNDITINTHTQSDDEGQNSTWHKPCSLTLRLIVVCRTRWVGYSHMHLQTYVYSIHMHSQTNVF